MSFEWDVQIVMRLLAAAVLGGLIGYERERMNRAAGLRTHVMVSLASALFTILSIYAFYVPGRVNDPARIAAQIVSGIGFLGAGTIMKHGVTVKGLTTAATLWVVAAIGMSCGAGYLTAAVLTCGVALITLVILRMLEHQIGGKKLTTIELTLPNNSGMLGRIHSTMEIFNIKVKMIEMEEEEDGNTCIKVFAYLPDNISWMLVSDSLKEIGVTHIGIS